MDRWASALVCTSVRGWAVCPWHFGLRYTEVGRGTQPQHTLQHLRRGGSPCSFQHPWVQGQGAQKLPIGKKQRREGYKHRSIVSKSGKEVEPWSLRQAQLESSSFLPQGWHHPASTLPLRPKLKAKRPPSTFPRSESQGTTEGKESHQ